MEQDFVDKTYDRILQIRLLKIATWQRQGLKIQYLKKLTFALHVTIRSTQRSTG